MVRTWTPQEWRDIKKDTRLGLRDNRRAFLASEDRRHLHIHSEKVTANKLHSIHQQKTRLIAQHMGYVKRIRPSGLDTRGTDTTTQVVVTGTPTLLRSTHGAHLDSTGVA